VRRREGEAIDRKPASNLQLKLAAPRNSAKLARSFRERGRE
jgi:hypothetical protein